MSSPNSTPTQTILFLGATGGVALSTLRRSLAANHTCLALCRTPSTLLSKLDTKTRPSNLHIIQGNAHSATTLATQCLPHPTDPIRLVDTIVFSIGARPTLTGMSDPNVCENGMVALLQALKTCREEKGLKGKPRLAVVSSTGISEHGRDIPLAMVPLYKMVLGTAHADKRAMERIVMGEEMGGLVEWTLVRPSFYTNGPATEGLVRVGKEDPVAGVVERTVVGYTISRQDVGKWVFENCVVDGGREWVSKAAVVTY